MNTEILLLSVFTGVIAGFIDTIAGGGGLITVPVLLGFNLPPAIALGTNRLQGCIGEMTSSTKFLSSGELPIRDMLIGLFFTMIGATFGSLFDENISEKFLNHLIPLSLIFLIVFLVISKPPKENTDKPKINKRTFFVLFGLVIGFYNGFFGPSTGFFWITTLMVFLGINLRYAIMRAKPLNFIGNLASLFVFIYGGSVSWPIGLSMGAGQILGAYAGANFILVKNVKVIKPLFLSIAFILAVHILYKAF